MMPRELKGWRLCINVPGEGHICSRGDTVCQRLIYLNNYRHRWPNLAQEPNRKSTTERGPVASKMLSLKFYYLLYRSQASLADIFQVECNVISSVWMEREMFGNARDLQPRSRWQMQVHQSLRLGARQRLTAGSRICFLKGSFNHSVDGSRKDIG